MGNIQQMQDELNYQHECAIVYQEEYRKRNQQLEEFIKVKEEQNEGKVKFSNALGRFIENTLDENSFEKDIYDTYFGMRSPYLVGLLVIIFWNVAVFDSWNEFISSVTKNYLLSALGLILQLVIAGIIGGIYAAILTVINRIFNPIYANLPHIRSKIKKGNEERKELSEKLNQEMYDLNDEYEEDLNEFLEPITIPLNYASNYSYINRMKDNIETGRAKSIKEAILILDDYVQKEDFIESQREAVDASKEVAMATEKASEQIAYEMEQAINENQRQYQEWTKTNKRLNEKLDKKLDEISDHTDPKWK